VRSERKYISHNEEILLLVRIDQMDSVAAFNAALIRHKSSHCPRINSRLVIRRYQIDIMFERLNETELGPIYSLLISRLNRSALLRVFKSKDLTFEKLFHPLKLLKMRQVFEASRSRCTKYLNVTKARLQCFMILTFSNQNCCQNKVAETATRSVN